MAISGTEFFIPPGDQINQAFDVAKSLYPETVGAGYRVALDLSSEDFSGALERYLLAAAAFLSSRSANESVTEICAPAWNVLRDTQITTLVTSRNFLSSPNSHLVPEAVIEDFRQVPDEPKVIFIASPMAPLFMQRAYIYLQPDFLVTANARPAEAIGAIASLSSRVRDFATGAILFNQDHVFARSEALEAEILSMAIQSEPSLQLRSKKQLLLQKYPQGLKSLPPGVMY